MIHPRGKLNASKYIEDTKTVRRTWTERLLTLPWKPWVATKQIDKTKWVSDKQGGVLCSITTYRMLAQKRIERRGINKMELK